MEGGGGRSGLRVPICCAASFMQGEELGIVGVLHRIPVFMFAEGVLDSCSPCFVLVLSLSCLVSTGLDWSRLVSTGLDWS